MFIDLKRLFQNYNHIIINSTAEKDDTENYLGYLIKGKKHLITGQTQFCQWNLSNEMSDWNN